MNEIYERQIMSENVLGEIPDLYDGPVYLSLKDGYRIDFVQNIENRPLYFKFYKYCDDGIWRMKRISIENLSYYRPEFNDDGFNSKDMEFLCNFLETVTDNRTNWLRLVENTLDGIRNYQMPDYRLLETNN